jgi:5-methylcytosine-specific restriction endonuclease McrA
VDNDEYKNTRTFSKFDKNIISRNAHNLCEICRNKTDRMVYDHWVPHSKGANTFITNCVYLCETCNLTKKDKDPLIIVKKVIQRINKIETRISNVIFPDRIIIIESIIKMLNRMYN